MASLNRVELIGNLGADPEIRSTRDGKQIANMRLACSENWKDRNGDRQERTEWISVVCFNENLVKIIKQYVRKGSKIYCSGRFQTRKWQDQSGNDRFSTEVVMQAFDGQLILLDGKSQGDAKPSDNRADNRGSMSSQYDADLDDEVPGFD